MLIALIGLSLLCTLLLGLIIAEIAFLLSPNAFPDNLRAMMDTDNPTKLSRKPVVEKLPYSPFAKPYPNVDVLMPGYYGPKDTFFYGWRSDNRGFKNLPKVARRKQVDVIALGDNHTEGVGVAAADTWTTRLTRKGLPTYSLGIEGYAPTQMLGTYERYGRALRPKWVIVGMLSNVITRERQFLGEMAKAENWVDRKLPGAIGELQERDKLHAQRPVYFESKEGYRVPIVLEKRHRFITPAFVDLIARQLEFSRSFDVTAGIPNPENDLRFASDAGTLSRYRDEVIAACVEIDPDALTGSPEWIATDQAITRIAQLAKSDSTRVLVLFFPYRGTAYYKRVIGQDLPPNSRDLVHARVLRDFAKERGLHFLDLTPIFQRASAELTDGRDFQADPYLKIDGHESPRGHEIIASEVEAFIRATGPF